MSNVPKVRFKEFSGEWEQKTLGEVSNKIFYGIGSSAINFDGLNKYLRITDIDESSRTFIPNPLTSPDGVIEDKYKLVKGDIVFARTGASVGKSYLYKEKDGNLIYAGFLIKFHIKKANPNFVYHNTFREYYNNWVKVMSVRSGQPGLNAEEYKQLPINLPSNEEQEKVASFLTSVDTKIEQLAKKEKLLQQYKKGVMQKIFNQEIRFKADNGSEFCEWEEKKLEDFLNLTLREVPKPNENYLAIGIRSHCKGTFQKPDSEPEKIAMDKLYVVKENDLIVNITFAWESAIAIVKKEDEGGLVSHRFPTYTFNKDLAIVEFFRYVIIQKKFRLMLDLISPGGAGRNRVMSKKDFLKLKWELPCVEEQNKIANFLSSIDTKIEQTQRQLEQTKEFKKALLQQMFV
jgi:type I restriction enzyme, S subunit